MWKSVRIPTLNDSFSNHLINQRAIYTKNEYRRVFSFIIIVITFPLTAIFKIDTMYHAGRKWFTISSLRVITLLSVCFYCPTATKLRNVSQRRCSSSSLVSRLLASFSSLQVGEHLSDKSRWKLYPSPPPQGVSKTGLLGFHKQIIDMYIHTHSTCHKGLDTPPHAMFVLYIYYFLETKDIKDKKQDIWNYVAMYSIYTYLTGNK